MKSGWVLGGIVIAMGWSCQSKASVPNAEAQIAGAERAAPDDRGNEARVLGYDAKGDLVELRAGKNELVCLADDPKKEGFQAACYHKDLEPYMARGRALAAEGVGGQESLQTRWKEIESGKLAMAKGPRTLHVMSGKSFDMSNGEVVDGYLRWVVYIPFATPESTGLPTSAGPGTPWLMFPGTAGAHIMVSPKK